MQGRYSGAKKTCTVSEPQTQGDYEVRVPTNAQGVGGIYLFESHGLPADPDVASTKKLGLSP